MPSEVRYMPQRVLCSLPSSVVGAHDGGSGASCRSVEPATGTETAMSEDLELLTDEELPELALMVDVPS